MRDGLDERRAEGSTSTEPTHRLVGIEMETVTEKETAPARETKTALMWAIGVVLGVIAGLVHIAVEDPLLTAFCVTASTMALGVARPDRPWRWTLVVGVFVPLVLIVATLTGQYANFKRVTLLGSLLAFLPGIAGAFGGSFMRRFFDNVFFADK